MIAIYLVLSEGRQKTRGKEGRKDVTEYACLIKLKMKQEK